MTPAKKYILSGCLLAAGSSILIPLAGQTDPDEITWIPRVSAPPLIDGEIDDLWYAMEALPIAIVQTGTVENDDDLSARWWGLYDEENYYFLIDTRDQVLESEAGSDIWRNDRIEIYFNMDNVKPGGNGHSGDNYQYAFHWNKPDEQFVNNGTWTGVEWAYTTTSYGYITEVKIPFATLTTLDAVPGFSFGFDIAINDNDGFAVYDSVTYWWNTGGGLWSNIDGAGTVGLGDLFNGNFAPMVMDLDTQIVFEGQTSVINISASDLNPADTLTFTAPDLPAFASLANNGDGTATITVDAQPGEANIYMFAVTASDGAREDSTEVTMIVKDPAVTAQIPEFQPIGDTAVTQGNLLSVDITAIDLDSLTLDITGTDIPDFVTVTDNGDKTATIEFNPGFEVTPQMYSVTLQARDPEENIGTITFSVDVQSTNKLVEYYCDPLLGNMENDGSAESPWSSLEDVFTAGKLFAAGDVIYLRDGYHGEPVITAANSDYVYIMPEEEAMPTCSRISFTGSSRFWHLSGVQISRSFVPEFTKATMLSINGHDNIVSDCDIFTVPDISAWTLTDWLEKSTNGVSIGDSRNLLENCTVLNTSFAVQVSGTFNVVRGNRIQNFSGDGLRGLGDDLLFEYNHVTDNYNIDDNHDDGFQSWSNGSGGVGSGIVHRITLRGNVFIETTDPDRPFQGSLQGIGCFDGMFQDWVIENNVVLVNQWHGIALYGAINCRIVNNTVIDQAIGRDPGPTWITVLPHKDYASAPTQEEKDFLRGGGNVVRNNLTTRMRVDSSYGEVDNNHVIGITSLNTYFIDYPNDLRLKAGSPAIDAGVNTDAPARDADGNLRTFDGDGDGETTTDFGAYEFGAGSRGLANLSTRGSVGTGDNVMIPGFVVSGSGTKRLLIRAIGPTLADFGVTGVLENPVVSVFSGGTVLDENDDWGMRPDVVQIRSAATRVGAFPIPDASQDSVILMDFAPGSYTARAEGAGATTGIAILELYDADEAPEQSTATLANISTRGYVGVGESIMIPGFVIDGPSPKKLLIRSVGPTLGELGVSGALADTTMEVFAGNVNVAENDDWWDQPDAEAIELAAEKVGAFALGQGSKDSSLLLELDPGGYSVHASGVDGQTGVALVELYVVP